MDTNNVIIVGRLTRDPETKTVGEYRIVEFSLAVGERKKDETSFFEVKAWGKLAEIVSQYASKGKQILVSGRLKQDRWNKDGKNFSKVYINAETVQLLGAKSEPRSIDDMGTQVPDPFGDEVF